MDRKTININAVYSNLKSKKAKVTQDFKSYENATIEEALHDFALDFSIFKNKQNGYYWKIKSMFYTNNGSVLHIELEKQHKEKNANGYETIETYLKSRKKKNIWRTIKEFFKNIR